VPFQFLNREEASLHSLDGQDATAHIKITKLQSACFGGSETVAVRRQNHRPITD